MAERRPVFTSDPKGCPLSVKEVNAYLDLEDYDRNRKTLKFQFNAECSDRTYWVWSYCDSEGELNHCVVTVKHGAPQSIIGCGVFDNADAEPTVLVAEMLQKDV